MMTTNDLEFVILAAGKSTRNYPHSKGISHKCLMPFGSVKIIDFIMAELLYAGAKHITIVVSDEKAKEAFELAFAREKNIEEKFERSGNVIGLNLLKKVYIPNDVEIKYVIQKEPKGLGHAIGLANKLAGVRHLVVRLPDDIVISTFPDENVFKNSLIVACVNEYIKGDGGNMFITRQVEDPSRWGIIENGVFIEKPKESQSKEAFNTMAIFDKKVAARLEEVATLIDTMGTEEYNMWERQGKEIHFDKYLNDEVLKDKALMHIRTFVKRETDKYLDCGTIKGYEEALVYTLLKLSVFKDGNQKIAKEILKI